MIIKGLYKKDNNFITVFSDDTMYTIARNSGEWGFVKVGGTLATGQKFSKSDYEKFKKECTKVGIFTLF